jgi:hypothetical protein
LFPVLKPTRDEPATSSARCPRLGYRHGTSKTEGISDGISVPLALLSCISHDADLLKTHFFLHTESLEGQLLLSIHVTVC